MNETGLGGLGKKGEENGGTGLHPASIGEVTARSRNPLARVNACRGQ